MMAWLALAGGGLEIRSYWVARLSFAGRVFELYEKSRVRWRCCH